MLVTFLVFAAVAIVALVVTILYLMPGSRRNGTTVPCRDPSDEKLGNLPDISAAGSLHAYLVQLHEDLGPVAAFWFKTQLCVSVASADAFKDTVTLFDRPKQLFEFLEGLTGDKTVQFANGEEGRSRHRLYSQAFAHKTCVQVLPKLNKISSELVSNWSQLPPDEHIPLHEFMMALAIRMLTATHFGKFFTRDHANTIKFHRLYEVLMNDLEAIQTGDLKDTDQVRHKAMEKNLTEFRNIVRAFVEEHRAEKSSGDYELAPFLDSLLDNASDEEELVADAITFVVGGFHTTGNFLTWALYYLAINTEVQDRVAREILDVVGKNDDLTEEAIAKLHYTTQVMDETLRFSAVAPFAARVDTEKAMRVCGHVLPPATPVIHALGVAAMDEKYFNEPCKFNPDHFSAESVRKRPSFAFAPFGIGQRKCPGYKFSTFEVYAALASILRELKIELAFDNDYFIEPKFGFVTKPETEIWIKIKRRA